MNFIFSSIVHFGYNLLYKVKKSCFKNYSFRKFSICNKITSFVMNQKLLKIHTNEDILLYLDSKDSLGLSFNKYYELNETHYILNNIKDDMHIIDIGANIGYYTTLFCKKAYNGIIYAFEPDLENFSLLEKNTSKNHFSNVKLFNKACGEACCEKELYLSSHNKGDHRLYDVTNEKRNRVQVNVVTLDSLLSDIDRLDFIKIDIQGYELPALKGAIGLLKRFKPIVLSEFWPEGLKINNVSPQEYINFFYHIDYEIYSIDSFYLDSQVIKLEKKSLESLLDTTDNDKNILLIHKNARN